MEVSTDIIRQTLSPLGMNWSSNVLYVFPRTNHCVCVHACWSAGADLGKLSH